MLIHVHYRIENSIMLTPLSHSWNSSRDAKMGHLRTFIVWKSSKLLWRYLYWRLLAPARNSLLNAVFIFTLSCLSIMSRTRSSTTLPASFKNRCCSMWFRIYFTAPINIRFSNTVWISRYQNPYPARIAPNPSNSRVLRYMRSLIVSCQSIIAGV